MDLLPGWLEKIAKFTPLPSHVAPNGCGWPSQTLIGVINEPFLSASRAQRATECHY